MLQVGDHIPAFSVPNQNGRIVNATDLTGHWVVFYFYPKDNTAGCTQEACDFREVNETLKRLDCQIFGISKDSAKSHTNFISKYGLPFDLLSDASGELCQSFGVWVEKSMYGKKYFGIQRATFLINPNRQITHVWENVRVKNHARDVLATLQAKLL